METTEPQDKRNIAEIASDYVETYLKLTMVNINQKTAAISSVASFSMIIGLLVFFMLMFLGMAAAYWLGTLLSSTALGFLLVAGFYLLLVLVLFFSRKKLFYPFIKNLIVKSIYE